MARWLPVRGKSVVFYGKTCDICKITRKALTLRGVFENYHQRVVILLGLYNITKVPTLPGVFEGHMHDLRSLRTQAGARNLRPPPYKKVFSSGVGAVTAVVTSRGGSG